ncbi:DUF6265 family protein [Sphingomonas sp. DT-204]|uniref:DUF6265 family protein n=1 Tax=Sphingomonas sp. DT-204 TaxID=3396166 RepID=UPI003F1B88E0
MGSVTLLAALLFLAPAAAQDVDPRAMIRLHAQGQASPSAAVADMAWIEGHWIGQMPDGPVEHVILGPRSGHLPGFVRGVDPRGVFFYEISLFVETGGSLAYRVKHFGEDLAGWEAQADYINRPLVARDGERFYFDGITFARTGPDSFTVYFLNRVNGEERGTLVIPFRRK